MRFFSFLLTTLIVGSATCEMLPQAVAAPATTGANTIAIATQVGGKAVVHRGATTIPLAVGTKLQVGDHITVQTGTVTVYFLGGPPRHMSAKQTLAIAAPAQKSGASLWRGVYVGLSQGFASGGIRVAATMRRKATLKPLAPVNTSVLDDATPLRWSIKGLHLEEVAGYEVEILDMDGEVLATKRAKETQVSLAGLKLPHGPLLRWRVTPYRQSVTGKPDDVQFLDSWTSPDANFSFAAPDTAGQIKAMLAQIERMKSLTSDERHVARSALLIGRGFFDEALGELEGVKIPAANILRAQLEPQESQAP